MGQQNTSTQTDAPLGTKEQEIYDSRLEKAGKWKELGVHPWGNGYRPDHLAAEIHARHGSQSAEEMEKAPASVYRVAGRVVAVRSFGKAAFLQLRDRSGEIQVHVKRDALGDAYERMKLIDLGDFVGVTGSAFRTHKGELTLAATEFLPLAKSLRPPPEKWHGLTDVEARYRQRYLDLIGNPEVKKTFERRNALVRFLRRSLDDRGFIEVETPMMHPLVSGAAARPFVTHHNTFDVDLYLRIAPELYLKRLVVGGFERVYEMNRNFRNEGISTRHNPEFTMLEFYQAYATHEDLMSFTEELISEAAKEVTGQTLLPYQGQKLDFAKGWKRIPMVEAIRESVSGLSDKDMTDADRLRHELLKTSRGGAERAAIDQMTLGELIGALFEAHVEHTLVHPTFITQFPIAVSPLARRNDQNPDMADRFELFVAGREIANAFSELNDPLDQRERFLMQVKAKERGQKETMDYDEDYIRALEQGMPPTAGEGIGIDRLAMLFTDSASIRDVILFPLLKPIAQ
jgi:lysyl-tRNA synthetase class 2